MESEALTGLFLVLIITGGATWGILFAALILYIWEKFCDAVRPGL